MITKIFFSKKETLVFALEELKEKLDSCFEDFDFLIFSFHPKYYYNDIIYFVNKVFKTDKWIGFNSIDAFCNDKIVEGIVLTAIKFEKKGFVETFSIEDITQKNALIESINYLTTRKDKLHIILTSVGKGKIAYFIEEIGKNLFYCPLDNIIGGVASGIESNGEFLTYIFTPQKVIKNGFVVVSFSNIEFEIGIALGFKSYGVIYEVDKAQENRIYKVDDGKNFAEIVKKLASGIEDFRFEYLWYCPINILDDKEGYVATLRTIKGVTDEYVEFFGPVKKGDKFKFSFAENIELLKEDKKIALHIKEKISHPDLVLNFSCVARQYVLEDKKIEENKIYMNMLNSHLFGFFTFGEIGPDKFFNSLKFYNETSLIVALKEK